VFWGAIPGARSEERVLYNDKRRMTELHTLPAFAEWDKRV